MSAESKYEGKLVYICGNFYCLEVVEQRKYAQRLKQKYKIKNLPILEVQDYQIVETGRIF